MEATNYDTINFSYVIQLGGKERTMLDEHISSKNICVWKCECIFAWGIPNVIFFVINC